MTRRRPPDRIAGAPPEATREALSETTDEQAQRARCQPGASSARDLAKVVDFPGPQRREELTDTGLEDRFVRLCGDQAKWFSERGTWSVYTGTHWSTSHGAELAMRMTRKVVHELFQEAARADARDQAELGEFALYAQHERARNAMLRLARTRLVKGAEDFDRDPYLFNVHNGTIDLRTGDLRPHAAADMITQLAPYRFDAAATAPTWLRFLAETFDGDEELVGFMQRAIGMAMVGEVLEHAFVLLLGRGRNGKSTLLNLILTLFGSYGRQINSDIVLRRKHDQHPTEFANLLGRRLAVMNEVPKGRTFNESSFKTLTGGDRVSARFTHQDHFDFVPSHSLFLAANTLPQVDDDSDGFWRRMMLVPFNVQVPEDRVDPTLPRRLLEEAPGILAWCVEGALEWQRVGLAPPAQMRAATKSYRDASNTVDAFLGDCCRREGRVKAKDLLTAYRRWCSACGETPEGRNDFYGRMATVEGVEIAKPKGVKHFMGVSLDA